MRILVSTLALVALGSTAAASSYVVAPTGSDGNDGSMAHPWATLQHAADTVAAGDNVAVKAGSYAGFQLETSGTAGKEIIFVGQPGAQITADNGTTPDGINLEGASYVRIEGFTINGRTRAGIRAVTCDHVTIRGNRTDQNGRWGIFTGFCDDLLIENNETSRSGTEHGIYVSNSGDRPVIRGNLVWGNHGNGIHMNGDISSGGDGIISGALVEANIVYGNGVGGGSGINCDGVQGSTYRNNLVFANLSAGLSLYMIDGAAGSTGNTVINNTILMPSGSRWALNIQDASSGNHFINNILLHDGARGALDISADSLPGTTSDYNVVTSRFTKDGGSSIQALAAWTSATGLDAHSRVATSAAVFVDPAATNAAGFALADGSPAIDHGTATGAPPTDLAGNPRPQGAGIDVGALEKCTGPCVTPPGSDAGVGEPDAGAGGGDG
ncbi:MAG: right-handed parallel beta-helix repeat-containing protein, partial [Deltaproteobacteria bacterium]|nr:right-handed parallel beta-helix repeat-containing protein [Deltaproteobacteria bacterium]